MQLFAWAYHTKQSSCILDLVLLVFLVYRSDVELFTLKSFLLLSMSFLDFGFVFFYLDANKPTGYASKYVWCASLCKSYDTPCAILVWDFHLAWLHSSTSSADNIYISDDRLSDLRFFDVYNHRFFYEVRMSVIACPLILLYTRPLCSLYLIVYSISTTDHSWRVSSNSTFCPKKSIIIPFAGSRPCSVTSTDLFGLSVCHTYCKSSTLSIVHNSFMEYLFLW